MVSWDWGLETELDSQLGHLHEQELGLCYTILAQVTLLIRR